MNLAANWLEFYRTRFGSNSNSLFARTQFARILDLLEGTYGASPTHENRGHDWPSKLEPRNDREADRCRHERCPPELLARRSRRSRGARQHDPRDRRPQRRDGRNFAGCSGTKDSHRQVQRQEDHARERREVHHHVRRDRGRSNPSLDHLQGFAGRCASRPRVALGRWQLEPAR